MPSLQTGHMEFKPGAVMSQIVLADEINRTSPRTQSSLLEVMEEGQVTVDGITHPLPRPFMVLATQNPVDFVGTYPLPEAQMDRFFLRIRIGYPSVEEEMDVLARYSGTVSPLSTLQSICTAQDVVAMQEQVGTIYCSREALAYVAKLTALTREHPQLALGASPRAGIALVRAAQACAVLSGRDYVLPDDIIPVFSGIIKKQGYAFAKSDDEVIREAVRWADVVHLEEPFDLQIRRVLAFLHHRFR